MGDSLMESSELESVLNQCVLWRRRFNVCFAVNRLDSGCLKSIARSYFVNTLAFDLPTKRRSLGMDSQDELTDENRNLDDNLVFTESIRPIHILPCLPPISELMRRLERNFVLKTS